MISSPTSTTSARLPVFFVVDAAAELLGRAVELEAAPREDLDDARRLREADLPRRPLLLGDADHLRVAAQEDVCRGRVERLAQLPRQLAGRQQVLNVDLAAGADPLARRQRQVLVAGVALHQLLVDGAVRQVLAVADAAGGQDGALVI